MATHPPQRVTPLAGKHQAAFAEAEAGSSAATMGTKILGDFWLEKPGREDQDVSFSFDGSGVVATEQSWQGGPKNGGEDPESGPYRKPQVR